MEANYFRLNTVVARLISTLHLLKIKSYDSNCPGEIFRDVYLIIFY